MNIDPLIIQFVGSLIAIFAIFGLSRVLGLGGKPVLADEEAVRAAAGEVMYGFEAVRVSISRDHAAALAKDADGQIMVIKRHGNRFAGRVLSGAASVREEVDGILVDPSDPHFGTVRLSVRDANAWADAIHRL